MSKLTNQWIELFRAGNHGEKGAFSEADLDQIVANYQPATGHEAPATIGHPTGDAPAYGWFDGLKREGSLLLGKMREVQPQFEELVSSKLFKKRSVGLVKGESGWSLHHVAFLGAQAPEIKGLADCKFDASRTPVVEVEFQENQMPAEDTVIASLKAWFEEKFGTRSTATTVTSFSEADVKRIATEAVTAAVAPLQAALDAQKTEFAERDKKLTTNETTARADAAIVKLKSSGRWVPAFDKLGLAAVFAELAKITTTVEFGEGADKKTVTPLDTLVAFMEQLPKIVPTGDVYTGQTARVGAAKTSNVNDSLRAPADPNSIALHQFAEARAADKKITYGEALTQVIAEKPELTIPGGAAAGAV